MQLRLLVLMAVTFAPLTLVPDCCSDKHYAIGQDSQGSVEPITLVESKSFVWDGFTNARVVDGKVIADVTSKPKFKGATSQIILSLADGYSISEIVAESTPSLEFVDLVESDLDAGKTELQFAPDTKPGTYRIEVKASKPGVSRQAVKRLNIVIGGNGPAPPDVDVGFLPVVSQEARKVMADYVAMMAKDMDALAANASKYKTVSEASAASNALDLSTRNAFKAAIANVMQPRLGSTELPPTAAQVFADIATGYRSVK